MPETQVTEQLKAERIQVRLKAERIQEKLKAERIQQRLAEVPGWRVADSGAALTRAYDLPSLRASGLFTQLVLEIGEQNGYVPQIDVRHLEVTLTVATHTDHGPTDLDFDVARVLDSRL